MAYALASRPLMEEICEELRAGGTHAVLAAYLDDVTLVFQTEDALKVWEAVTRKWEAAGLPLNLEKCAIWTRDHGVSLPDPNPNGLT
eukprot:5244765-Prorocentrum_lima.AAC.1